MDEPSIGLPSDLFQHEVLYRLDFESLWAYCESNAAARAFCEENDVLIRRLHQFDYEDLKQAILYWDWRGLRLDELIVQIAALADRLDLATVHLAYLYLREQEKRAEAMKIHTIVAISGVSGSLSSRVVWLDQQSYDYTRLGTFIDQIKGRKLSLTDISHSIVGQLTNQFQIFTDYPWNDQSLTKTRYLARLIVNALNDQDIVYLLTHLQKVFFYPRPYYFHFFLVLSIRQLYETDRLTMEMVSICVEIEEKGINIRFLTGVIPPTRWNEYGVPDKGSRPILNLNNRETTA